MVCISRWIVVAVLLLFFIVLLARCQRAATVMQPYTDNVSRETLSDKPFTPEKQFV